MLVNRSPVALSSEYETYSMVLGPTNGRAAGFPLQSVLDGCSPQPVNPRLSDTELQLPSLRPQRQFVQLRPGLAPCRAVLAQQGEEPLAMGGLDQVKHLVDYDILEQIPGLLHELGIQPNVQIGRASCR